MTKTTALFQVITATKTQNSGRNSLHGQETMLWR